MTRRQVSALGGGVVALTALWLESHYSHMHSQILILSAMAIIAPVGLAWVTGEFRKLWFWIALPLCVFIHILLLLRFHLPFESTSNAFVVGGIEIAGLVVVSGVIRDTATRLNKTHSTD